MGGPIRVVTMLGTQVPSTSLGMTLVGSSESLGQEPHPNFAKGAKLEWGTLGVCTSGFDCSGFNSLGRLSTSLGMTGVGEV